MKNRLIFLGLIMLSLNLLASGTYINPPPKPRSDIDCSLEKNKTHDDCSDEDEDE